jgi:hypothetical protein
MSRPTMGLGADAQNIIADALCPISFGESSGP